MNLWTRQFATPYGDMTVAMDENGALTHLILPNGHERWAREIARKGYRVVEQPERLAGVVAQLDEYFEGRRRTFDVTLRPVGTEFQRAVWASLRAIPYGATITYKELARRAGNVAAVRAAGRANGSNPIPIIMPCHRVIGTDGSLTGFGGGIALKEALLRLEGAISG